MASETPRSAASLRQDASPVLELVPKPKRSPLSSLAAHLFFAFLFVGVLITAHSSVLDLPYFWDELGQFIPAALDIYYDGDWIAKSTLPNVHPPGLMAYLALVWKVFGYSVIVTRVSLLVLAGAGVLFVFHLAVLLCRGVGGLPALSAVLLLLCSPLFFTQSMMAQLDMPAMVFTALALWLFLKDRFALSAAACVLLVLMKETALTTPAVFGAWLLWERRWRQALYFVAPALAVGGWLAYLKAGTGHWLGNKEFTHYNVWFQFHPIRLPLTLIRRAFYLFVDNFHWIGTIVVWLAWRRTRMFYTRAWAVTGTVFVAQVLMVSVFGGAALERYLMPVLPLFYIAVGSALLALTVPTRRMALGGMAAGLIAAIFLPPVFPYPYENNIAVVDFVRLHAEAADAISRRFPDGVVASAWPFPDALRRTEFGYVSKPMQVVGLSNFDTPTVLALQKQPVDVLVLYSRTWEPGWSVSQMLGVKRFLSKYYFYAPQVSSEDVQRVLGMEPILRLERRGQWIEVYSRTRMPEVLVL